MASETIIFCIPVFNDWDSAVLLIDQINRIVGTYQIQASVLLVDDGSTESVSQLLGQSSDNLRSVDILQLRRNIGHQRAIALGLTYIYSHCSCQAVVVMDGDGEDAPEDAMKLLKRFYEHQGTHIIFAQRSQRSEGFVFKVFYQLYKFVYRVLTGRKIEVGNFSIVPAKQLDRLISISELWNHYAASIFKARLPVDKVPIARAYRLRGKSKMNFVALITHGLSAISVFGEEVGVRSLIATGILILFMMLGLVIVAAIRLLTNLAIPGWATVATGIFSLALLEALMLSIIFIFIVLQARNQTTFIPLRDYQYYISHVIPVTSRQ